MKKLAVLSQKGGAGKTTLALHIAVAAELDGSSTAIVDLDPQASASDWGDSREDESPAVVSGQAARLDHILKVANGAGADLIIIDTAPHSENASLQAARVADFVLIPCRPAILDLRAIGHTVDIVKLANKPASIVLNAVPPQGSIAYEAARAIKSYEVDLAPINLVQRVAYQHSLTAGLTAQEYEPSGKAANEIRRLYDWVKGKVGM
ncbi:MAG: ParA family partition ATPase [Cyanobacteria bacterium P01_A01_bin.17]